MTASRLVSLVFGYISLVSSQMVSGLRYEREASRRETDELLQDREGLLRGREALNISRLGC